MLLLNVLLGITDEFDMFCGSFKFFIFDLLFLEWLAGEDYPVAKYFA